MYPYILSEANKGRISFNKAVELARPNPAKLFGIDHLKGALRVGLDAVMIYDPNKNVTVTNDAMHGNTDHTILGRCRSQDTQSQLAQRCIGLQRR